MKTLTTGIISLSIVAMLFSCDSKERERLAKKVDSLNVELQASKKVEATLVEVGSMIDSIDVSRQALNTRMVEGTSYSDYINRLKDINTHIRDTQKKIETMELSAKKSASVSSAAIRRLKEDLQLRSNEIVALQLDIAKAREENKQLSVTITHKDSVLSTRDEVIKVKESDIADLQGQVKQINEESKNKVANMYFDQAQALETAANRTKFAPKKKKETRREALELYKLSLSLGKAEAQAKIDQLEKELG